jgi:hypothetical protein
MRINQAIVAIAAGLIVSSLGVVLILALLVFGGWPTYFPFLLLLYGLPFLFLGVWALRRVTRPEPPWAARNVAFWSLPIMALGFAAWFGFTGVTSNVTYPMTWSYGDPSSNEAGERHVVLRFADFPNHHVGFYSSELAKYLESLPTPRINVEFEITRDFGDVRGYHAVRIGTLTEWQSGSSYGGHSGDNDPAPW